VNNTIHSAQNQSLWELLKADLKGLFPIDVFEIWFEPLECIKESDDGIVLQTSNDFTAIWIHDNYLDLIQKRLQLITGRPTSAEIRVSTESADTENEKQAQAHKIKAAKKEAKKEAVNAQNPVYLTLNPKNTFDNFVIGPGNQLAHAASLAITNNPPGRAYNPLFLYGSTGLGKTHLMHSVALKALHDNPKLKVVYISTEKFTNEFIHAIQDNQLTQFRKRYRSVDILLIDDIHFLSGKERIQEEFFHTFNELFESQKQIFLCSDRPASEISKLENRLVSRFQWGLVCDIQPPDLETRVAIIRKKAKDMAFDIPEEVTNFLAEKVTKNIRRIEGALLRIASHRSLLSGPISVETVAKFLHDIIQEEQQTQVSMDVIQQKVCAFYNISLADMVSKKRPANLVFPRQMAMYLSRLLTSHSLQEIGASFGGRDHGTVIHACKSIENITEQDEIAKRNLQLLHKQLANNR
jgi:chromosomal replication initiator protein